MECFISTGSETRLLACTAVASVALRTEGSKGGKQGSVTIF